jgi:hypothetical protein
MSSWTVDHWRKGPVARAIAEREGTGLSHPGGTPRHPRTAARARRITQHNHVKRGYLCRGESAPSPFRALLAGGYYDELRRAFEAADE